MCVCVRGRAVCLGGLGFQLRVWCLGRVAGSAPSGAQPTEHHEEHTTNHLRPIISLESQLFIPARVSLSRSRLLVWRTSWGTPHQPRTQRRRPDPPPPARELSTHVPNLRPIISQESQLFIPARVSLSQSRLLVWRGGLGGWSVDCLCVCGRGRVWCALWVWVSSFVCGAWVGCLGWRPLGHTPLTRLLVWRGGVGGWRGGLAGLCA